MNFQVKIVYKLSLSSFLNLKSKFIFNLGPAGFFENDVHRYPGVFSNINRYYKRHSRDSNRRLDNQGLDTKNSLNSLVANDAEKLNKLENLQLNNLNGLTFTDTKNKNMK